MPAVLACTSGTAAANYVPAVIEAHEARVPLIVLTADRPPELRDVGAGQTIDQVKLYGSAAKWYFEVDDHPATPERVRWLRQLACRAVWTASTAAPARSTSTSRCASRSCSMSPCRTPSPAAAGARADGRGSRGPAGPRPRRPAWPRRSPTSSPRARGR